MANWTSGTNHANCTYKHTHTHAHTCTHTHTHTRTRRRGRMEELTAFLLRCRNNFPLSEFKESHFVPYFLSSTHTHTHTHTHWFCAVHESTWHSCCPPSGLSIVLRWRSTCMPTALTLAVLHQPVPALNQPCGGSTLHTTTHSTHTQYTPVSVCISKITWE